MELSKQVVCRELSQKLEKLGVKQDSLWWWRKSDSFNEYVLTPKGYKKDRKSGSGNIARCLSNTMIDGVDKQVN